jgi:hypothetical protein
MAQDFESPLRPAFPQLLSTLSNVGGRLEVMVSH